MKFAKLLKFSILLFMLLYLNSCRTEMNLLTVPTVVVSITMPAEIKDTIQFANKTVTLRSQRLTYTAQTNKDGVAMFKDVVPDIYNIYTSWDLTREDYIAMADSINETEVENRPALISGIQSKMEIFEEDSIVINALLSVKQNLLISKVYAAGTLDNNNSLYDADQYIEIFNNSDEVQYLDSIYLALVEGDSPIGFPSSLFPTTLHARQVYRFPGNGSKFPVLPGKSVVICNSARNHTVSAVTSIDLQNADFEFKGGINLPNNQNVDSMILVFTSFLPLKEINLQRNGVNSVCLFKTKDDVTNYPLDPKPGSTSNLRYMRFNAIDVFDGVEILKYRPTGSIDPNSKRLQKFIDAAFTNISNTSGKNHESSDRKVDTQRSAGTGRVYLRDTNNSQADFVTVTDPTPKKYDKPLLLQ